MLTLIEKQVQTPNYRSYLLIIDNSLYLSIHVKHILYLRIYCVLHFWQKNDFYVLVAQLAFIPMFLSFPRSGHSDKGKKGNLNGVITPSQECR